MSRPPLIRLRPSLRAALLCLLLPCVAAPALAADTLEDGYDAYARGDVDAAIGIWQELAIQGNATAQLNLGQLYRLGDGVEQSDEQAVKWYILAAQNGSEIAAVTLVQMEQDGRASKADVAAAFPDSQDSLANSLAVMAGGDAPAAAVAPAKAPARAPAPTPAPDPAPRPVSAAVKTVPVDVIEPMEKPPRPPGAAAPAASPAPAPAPAKAAQTVAAATIPAPRTAPKSAPRQRVTPLPRGQYVVQLLASASRDSLADYAGQQLAGSGEPRHIVFTRRGSKTEYLLLLGPYPSQSAAGRALGRQPEAVRKGMPWVGGQPWVRTTDSVMRIAHYATE